MSRSAYCLRLKSCPHIVIRWARLVLWTLTVLLAPLQLDAHAASGERSAALHSETGNTYLAGAELMVGQSVSGDLFAAGGRVMVEGAVAADAALAGGTVVQRAAVGQDLRVAGGDVSIGDKVGGELVAAGGSVNIDDAASVAGPALLGGNEVVVDGRLGQGAKIYASRIVINGTIEGDARLYGREIEFGPAARIDGNLRYASTEPLPEESLAQVSGRVVREKSPEGWDEAPSGGVFWFHPLFFISMLANGVVLYLLFPNAVNGVRESIAGSPWRSLAAGLALLFTLPPVAVLLMVTVVGIPAGLGLFALYPLMLLLGYLAAGFFIGGKLARSVRQPVPVSKGRQTLFLAAALLLLAIAGAIPVLGWLFVFLMLAAGVGGWALWLLPRRGGTNTVPV